MNWRFWQKKWVLPTYKPQRNKFIKDKVPDIDFIQHMQKLELKDGDALVLKIERGLSQDKLKHIKDMITRLFKELKITGCRALILEKGMEIGVLRKEANID